MEIKIEDYEKNLDKLNKIIEKLSSGEVSLDESIKLYSEGILIYEALEKLLSNQKLKILTYENNEFKE